MILRNRTLLFIKNEHQQNNLIHKGFEFQVFPYLQLFLLVFIFVNPVVNDTSYEPYGSWRKIG